jgi:hypothetical protein
MRDAAQKGRLSCGIAHGMKVREARKARGLPVSQTWPNQPFAAWKSLLTATLQPWRSAPLPAKPCK